MEYPFVANAAFCYCAKRMDSPFLWLESDSVPIKPGWLSAIKAEFSKKEKPILHTSDFQTPFDLCCGVGCYDPKAIRGLCPNVIGPNRGFDGYLHFEKPELIARSHLIQHSYGCYMPDGNAAPWLFPEHQWLLRNTTMIFHKDSKQGLISC